MTLDEHIQLQSQTFSRLLEKGYNNIYQNMQYCVWCNGKRYCGEVDILTFRNGVFHFYEVKSSMVKYPRAIEQYKRFKESHPDVQVKGVFITKGVFKRIYL